MAYDIRQSLKISQQLLMTPQLQQAIKLLQLSRLELEEFVAQQIAENPALEEDVQGPGAEEKKAVERGKEIQATDLHDARMQELSRIVDPQSREKGQEVDWESLSRESDSAAPIPSTMRQSNNEEQPNYENYVSSSISLTEALMAQVSEIELDEIEKRAASLLIGNLDERGYLSISLKELAESENISLDTLEGVLDTVQRFDPPGIAARDLRECLLIQLKAKKIKDPLIEKMITLHLRELETRNFAAIANHSR